MTHDPQKMDIEEHERVQELRRSAKSRPHFNAQKDLSDNPHEGKVQHRRSRGFMFSGVSSWSNAAAAGDAIRRVIERREEFKAMQGTPVVHVKNGKPLTAHGAKMLGVPWPIDQTVNES